MEQEKTALGVPPNIAAALAYVLGWASGVIYYQGQIIMTLAIRDDGEMVVPYPD